MDQVSEIKNKIDVVDLISGYVPLKKAGRNFRGLCPFHSEKTPSFMVSQELQIFKCFGCGQAGDVFAFTQKIEGVEFPEALEKLAEKAGVTLQKTRVDPENKKKKTIYEINRYTAEFYHYLLLKHPVGKKALDYLTKKRNMKPETIKDFKLGYAPNSWDSLYKFLSGKKYRDEDLAAAGVVIPKNSGDGHLDKFRGRIVFPFTGIDEKVVGFSGRTVINKEPKYLNTSETPVFFKSSFLYGLNKARVALKQKGAILVEGPIDVISAHQHDINNVIATSGTAITLNQIKLISRYTKDLALCFDSDSAGSTAMRRGIEIAESEDFNLGVIIIPEKYQDLDELLQENPSLADKVVKKPIPIYDFFLLSAIKKNDRETAVGKKKIMEELVEVFSKVTNQVILDHYTKKISEELEIDEEVVKSLLHKRSSVDQHIETAVTESNQGSGALSKKSPHEYVIALLLKAPLDTAQTFLYKLGQKDFTEPVVREIFTELKEHLDGRKRKFDIKYFSSKLPEETQKVINDLYLWDLEEILDDPKKLNTELEAALHRIKKETAKRELKELTKKIKQAEAEGNKKLINECSKKIEALYEKLA